RSDNALFGYTVGPHAWKRFLHPPIETIWKARRDEHGAMTLAPLPEELPRYAFLGVRACELHAIAIQDRVFCDGPYPDTAYQARRDRALLIAVNCGQAATTCFCVSMQTGPKADTGYDLALTELEPGATFLAEPGTNAGARLLAGVPQRAATEADKAAADAVSARAATQMGRSLETDGLKELLQSNPNHPRWDEVAQRCLSCANCTMVCPTCFCITVDDHTDLTGAEAERVRRWDSCFTMNFSYLHGGAVRPSGRARYRQWMTHKLASWHDQFGTSGCVGCGRCIAWCPVGIDITEEAAAIRATSAAKGASHGRD
ncbi:MAG: 4Fe-4S dicluster domain-containing protein, partial [Proteobacteria bacterium]|nr:4Fe-4S dicluster domain-containing protein [Pseudomonadota bacterium]